MGFLSNLKNKMTGGGAKVTLQVENPKLNSPFKVIVSAAVSGSDLDIKKVYIYLKSVEKTTVRNVDTISSDGSRFKKDVHGEEILYPQTEFVISGPETLKANETYTWSKEISVSGGGLQTFKGRYAVHEWQLLAGLDAPGNDPDSGWLVVDLY